MALNNSDELRDKLAAARAKALAEREADLAELTPAARRLAEEHRLTTRETRFTAQGIAHRVSTGVMNGAQGVRYLQEIRELARRRRAREAGEPSPAE